ncbi:unnamed protein product [Adineta steineri]|uniref:G-protein coupled receptors family 1 profile domain-containing protein n=1 Tax=Adineta steineri TaxID=433720 RepID=A0A818VY85_9BILA|nr:unnamed protein product [Adineta steineri]CAF1271997.1 unnamed protein product [Adineta steineri]CAF3717756.1 unnamed protein product [Adineta steineri]CAF3808839.1 unnamed protein product [Adineta steineri]
MVHDQYMSLSLVNINITSYCMQFIDSLCYILVILGLVGNILGLLIFSSSRHTSKISSVYVYLATSSSIINIFCVIRYALVLHSKTRIIINNLIGHVWFACKLYELSFCFRLISSWIILFWMFERVTCVSKRLRTLFYRWNASQLKFIIPCIIIFIILGCVIGPPAYMYQPRISKNKLSNSTIKSMNYFCGLPSTVSIKWQKYFNELHLGLNHYTIRCFFSELFPAGTIIIFNSYIMYYLFRTSYQFSQINENKITKERQRTTSWMNIVLILHSCLFLSSLFSHVVGHFLSVEAHETWWVLLTVLGNCSLNFYVYCLSGKAFRKQIIHIIQRLIILISYKLQTCKQQQQNHQYDNFKIENLIYQSNHVENINQPKSYGTKNYPKTIGINSSSPISEQETSV